MENTVHLSRVEIDLRLSVNDRLRSFEVTTSLTLTRDQQTKTGQGPESLEKYRTDSDQRLRTDQDKTNLKLGPIRTDSAL